jgi:signal transduction histidine kinase
VTDDGRGFDLDGDSGEGFGLIGMRERVRLAAGRHEIESSPGRGTTVHAWIPVARDDGARRRTPTPPDRRPIRVYSSSMPRSSV